MDNKDLLESIRAMLKEELKKELDPIKREQESIKKVQEDMKKVQEDMKKSQKSMERRQDEIFNVEGHRDRYFVPILPSYLREIRSKDF